MVTGACVALVACGTASPPGSVAPPHAVSAPPTAAVPYSPPPCRGGPNDVAFVSSRDFHCVRASDLRGPNCNVYVVGKWYTFDQAHIEGRIGCRQAIYFELGFTRWLDTGPGNRCLDSLCAGTHPSIAGYRCTIDVVGDDAWTIDCRRPGVSIGFYTAG
jgi:hypothetical protein